MAGTQPAEWRPRVRLAPSVLGIRASDKRPVGPTLSLPTAPCSSSVSPPYAKVQAGGMWESPTSRQGELLEDELQKE